MNLKKRNTKRRTVRQLENATFKTKKHGTTWAHIYMQRHEKLLTGRFTGGAGENENNNVTQVDKARRHKFKSILQLQNANNDNDIMTLVDFSQLVLTTMY